MKLKNLILIFSPIFLLFNAESVAKDSFSFECNNNCPKQNRSNFLGKSLIKNKFTSSNSNSKENYLYKIKVRSFDKVIIDDYKFNKSILNIFLSENNRSNEERKSIEYEIESDIQYSIEDTFYAEGNVEITSEDAILRADKIEFDKNISQLRIYGNISFLKGTQQFRADYFEYDFQENKGLINNIYGVIDFLTFDKDFNFKEVEIEETNCLPETKDILNLPSQISLLGSSNIRLNNKLGPDAFKFDFSSIKKWRFKSEKIILGEDNFKSELVLFTNDPINSPQLIVKSKNFNGKVIDQKIQFNSKKTYLSFDDLFLLPIGNRTIKDSEVNSSWGIGYDGNEKDGLYLNRFYSTKKVFNNLNLNIRKYFLLQRAINGNSNAFREKSSSLYSDNVNSDINYLDYFALDTDLNTNLNKWNLNASLNFKTLNPQRFYDGISSKFNLVKNLYKKSKSKSNRENKLNECINNKQNFNQSYDLSVNLGFYANYNEEDIYSAYGSKLFTSFSSNRSNLVENYSLVFDLGKYQGANKDKNNIIDSDRYGIITSLNQEYKILNLNSKSDDFIGYSRFAPELIKSGIFLKSYVSTGLYNYGDHRSQSIISLGLGPKIVYGNSERNFLDYTKLSVLPRFIEQRGKSPFSFDQFKDDSIIDFDIEQQIIGPLIFGYNGILTISNDSENYGKFENKSFKVGINRRAYSINISYSPINQSSFLGFKIYSFDFKDSNLKF